MIQDSKSLVEEGNRLVERHTGGFKDNDKEVLFLKLGTGYMIISYTINLYL